MDEKYGEEVGHRLAPWPSTINRPYCWRYGHKFQRGLGLNDCRRCGTNQGDGFVLVLFLAVFIGLCIKLCNWVKNLVP